MRRRLTTWLALGVSVIGCQPIAGWGGASAPARGALRVQVQHAVAPDSISTQASLSDVARVIVTVQTPGNADQNQSLSNAQIVSGGASASLTFDGLVSGVATISAAAYDAVNLVVGTARATASVQQAQTTALALPIYLGPSYLFQASSGTLRTGVTVVDGTQIPVAPGSILTVAGNGTTGAIVDGALAINAGLGFPEKLARDGAGNLFVSQQSGLRENQIFRINRYGVLSTLAYRPPSSSPMSNGAPGLACESAGNLYLAEADTNLIRKVSPQGTAVTVAGTGNAGYSGDNKPATSANLFAPVALAIDSSDNLYILDKYNYRIRKVTPQGMITTFAGTGTSGYSGDGGPATAAAMGVAFDIAVDAQNNVYYPDSDAHVIRRITPSGTISTIAGTGTSGYSGDNGPALAAQLYSPQSVSVDSADNVYIVDNRNRIRRITRDGIISTVAGMASDGFSGDGGPAVQAQLALPSKVLADDARNLFVADKLNHRIRLIHF